MRGALVGAVALAIVALVVGWRAPAKEGRSAEAQPTPTSQPRAACTARSFRRLGSPRAAYAAVVRTRATAYRRPGRGPIATFRRLNVNGVPNVLAVRGVLRAATCEPSWYRVQIPVRPNGTVAYVRARDVLVGRIRTRIVVDLSERRLTLFRDGRALLETTVAVGSAATPTPTGRFYVNQRLLSTDPAGPYGPAALGISAFSDVLTQWTQGGPIAIHGTNEPSSVGQPVSNGCIRVRNRTLRRVFATAIAG
ncbi:MAG: L,D-transpeptidase, partial [Actinomycetota bacterium]|nr:L,D-transpeptidase [Actinomycetota bacterium]